MKKGPKSPFRRSTPCLWLFPEHQQLCTAYFGNVFSLSVLGVIGPVDQLALHGHLLALDEIILDDLSRLSPGYHQMPLGICYLLSFSIAVRFIGGYRESGHLIPAFHDQHVRVLAQVADQQYFVSKCIHNCVFKFSYKSVLLHCHFKSGYTIPWINGYTRMQPAG